MNEIKFTYVTGRMLTYTVRKPDGTLRGPDDRPLPETPPLSGYYTNNDRPDLVVGDMVIIKDSKTGNNVGSGEWQTEDASGGKADLPNGKPAGTGQNINIQNFTGILGSVQQAENLQIGDNSSIQKGVRAEDKKKGILKRILGYIGTIIIGIIAAVITDILGDFGCIKQIKIIIHNILTPK